MLLDIGRVLAGTHEPDELYQTIYEQASRVIETTGFYISLHDPEQDQGTVVFLADRGRIERPGITYRGPVIRAIESARSSASARRKRKAGAGKDDGAGEMRSAIAASLIWQDQFLGVISAQSETVDAFDASDLGLLVSVADLAAVAICNSRAMRRLDRQRDEYQQLEEIGRALSASLDLEEVLQRVVSVTRELMSAQGTSVWLLRPDGKAEVASSAGDPAVPVGTCVELPESLKERFADFRDPVLLDREMAAELLPPQLLELFPGQSVISVPMLAENDLSGVLVASHAQQRSYGRREVRLLERLAVRAAIAVANARLHEKVRLLSLTDPLTGLPNRRQMDIFLEKEFAAAVRGRPLSLVLFDLDDFKRYNDTEGHQVGDRILKRFAEVLTEHTRAMNLVARYGGDEFVVILSDTSGAGASAHAERVIDNVRQDAAMNGIGASAGIATYETDMVDPDDLIRAADEDLYRAKAKRARRAG